MLQPDSDVLALAVFGSYLQPERLDLWSDLDLLLVVEDEALGRFFPALDWLKPLGSIYAHEQSSSTLRHTTRVCFDDLRRIDVVIATVSGLAHVEEWPRAPFWKGLRVLFGRSAVVERILSRTFAEPELRLPSADQFQAIANQFWFKGVMAVSKVARNDLLIALHLALDMVRDCCVLGMMLRDRAEGTNHHRQGGIGNRLVADLGCMQQPLTASGILTIIEESGILFDELTAQWSDTYTGHCQPLMAGISRAREAVQA